MELYPEDATPDVCLDHRADANYFYVREAFDGRGFLALTEDNITCVSLGQHEAKKGEITLRRRGRSWKNSTKFAASSSWAERSTGKGRESAGRQRVANKNTPSSGGKAMQSPLENKSSPKARKSLGKSIIH